MSMELCVLGSGSAGNSSMVRFRGSSHVVLLDAGFGPRTVVRRMKNTGATLDHVRAILLTHLDRDHFSPTWYRTVLERRIPIHLHQRHVAEFYQVIRDADPHFGPMILHRHGLLNAFGNQPFQLDLDPAVCVSVRPIALSHDSQGTTGYILRHGDHRLGYATDLGHVPPALLDAMTDVHLLAIESNYDEQMEMQSPRPSFLKQRVMSNHGHLSNDQTLEALHHLFKRSRILPTRVVLLHLSRQCNCPDKVARLYAAHPHIAERLHLSHQTQPTPWLTIDMPHQPLAGEQIPIFDA